MEKRGFDYYLKEEILEKYRKMSVEFRLKWLFMGNKLRKYCPKETIKFQEKFRKGEI